MAAITVRPATSEDAASVAAVLERSFGDLEHWTPERVEQLAPESPAQGTGFWVAAQAGRIVGCIRSAAMRRADWYVVRELAAGPEPAPDILDRLLDAVLGALQQQGAARVRASTLDLESYLDAYRRRGFVPVRRAVTLAFDLTARLPDAPAPRSGNADVAIGDGSAHSPATLARLYVEGMRPYWDWYIDERGGAESLLQRATSYLASTPAADEVRLVAEYDGAAVGLGWVADLAAPEADMQGVYVLPDWRGRGIGSMLLRATLARTAEGARALVVPETTTFLEGEPPSIRLYRRLGARTRAEYVHLMAPSSG